MVYASPYIKNISFFFSFHIIHKVGNKTNKLGCIVIVDKIHIHSKPYRYDEAIQSSIPGMFGLTINVFDYVYHS